MAAMTEKSLKDSFREFHQTFNCKSIIGKRLSFNTNI